MTFVKAAPGTQGNAGPAWLQLVPLSMSQEPDAGQLSHTVHDLSARCKIACQAYGVFSAELVKLVDEQQDVLHKHEHLLLRASTELGVSFACSRALN